MKGKLPHSIQNWISLLGLTIAVISLLMIAVLFTLSLIIKDKGVYLGLVIYILLPAVLVVGLILIPVGMVIRSKRQKKSKDKTKPGWPVINLNNSRQRKHFFIAALIITLLLFISVIGSYEAFHFTESVHFCGQLCHKVMKPEYVAYQHSAHARVSCVECHVGPGADWYVRSKLSGLYQVYSTLFNKYPKPIPTPIENLRPAREVCEQCHWPQKFYSYKLRYESYYMTDKENTRWDLRLVMKTGPEHQALGLKEGIHWHINPNVKIEYIAADERREEIPWIRYTDLITGETTIYQDTDHPLSQEEIASRSPRTMDCIDCHNRPSHDYKSPMRFLNSALTSQELPPDLPEIKRIAQELCIEEYESIEKAEQSIRLDISAFYADNYPEIYSNEQNKIEQAIQTVQTLFSQNIFPEMNVRWDTHLSHIGHLYSKGCFRCHNETQINAQQNQIGKDCNLCHVITAQGNPGNFQAGTISDPLEFKHPVEIYEAWKEGLCSDCHEDPGI